MTSSRERVRERLCLAVDVNDIAQVKTLVTELRDTVGLFKVGKQLFTSHGPAVVRLIRDLGGNVFLDLKYHDIPNTVAEASRAAVRLGVSMFNVHASGGSEMMSTVRAAIEDEATTLRVPRPKILAVTVLTSITPEVLRNELKISMDLPQYVVALAKLAKSCGMDGVVASPKEITSIRDACGKDFIILTPGIRPATAEAHDQKRVMTPSAAIKLGADYLVVGRPILEARDRSAAAAAILQEMIDAQC